MGVNQNDIALLRIGSVTAVKTSGIEIAVDSDKNEPSILYKGDIIDNVTADSYVMIQRGYRKLVALVEEEYLTEDRQWRDDKYHRDADRYRRTLRASLQGELIDETFERGRTIMPMIGNTAYIATKRQVSAVYSPGTPPPTAPTDGPLPGSVIGCKQFSCSGDAVRRLIMGCRRMLGVEDRAAIMAGLEAGLSQTRIAHLIGRSPSVVCREIARHTGPDGQYQAEDAGRAAQVARRRPKKRLLDRDEILRRRVIFDLSQGRTPRQISGRLSVEACGTVAPMDNSPHAQGRTISHEAIYTWIYAHPKKTLIEHGVCLPSRRWMRKKPPAGGRTPPIVGMRLIDERPDIADRMIPGNWEGDLIIGKDGASACATLVERTTRYLIIVALPLGRRADQVCDALTRRIQGLPEGAMRTLTWDQGREMARHQRLTQDTGVEVFFAHPHSPWERGTNENTNRLIRRYLPKGTPITSHQPYLDAIAYELNNCPRATLGYRTPTEAFNQLIATTH